MTDGKLDPDLQDIADKRVAAMPARSHRTARREGVLIAAIALLAIAILLVFLNGQSESKKNGDRADANASAAAQLASQVASLGATPVTTPHGVDVTPSPGPPGARGVGIAGTLRVGDRLFLIGTDGTRWDAGVVVGPTGPSGSPGKSGSPGRSGTNGSDGANGRGISSSALVNGDLILNYNDGTSQDVGTVVGPKGDQGPQGVSVKSASISSAGHLILSYSDGSSGDAGPLPTGPVCPSGYSIQTETVQTTDGPLLTALCVANQQPTAGTPSGGTPS